MFTIEDFNALNDNGKAEAAWGGTFLGDRIEAARCIQLYSVSNFYVELCYDQQANRIDTFRAFNNIQELAPYFSKPTSAS